jgi:hypothetical protein
LKRARAEPPSICSNGWLKIAQLMPAHSEWLPCAVHDGEFALTGSIVPGLRGMILAYHPMREELMHGLDQDLPIAQGKVSVEINESELSRVDERMQFVTGS